MTVSPFHALSGSLALALALAAGAALAQTTTTTTTGERVVTPTGAGSALASDGSVPMPMDGSLDRAPPLASADRRFIMMANQGNLTEMATSELALTKSSNAEIKAFAQQMVTDHSAADGKLMPIAQTYGLTLPKTMDAHHQAAVNRLQRGRSGATFDHYYIAQMVKDHDMTVKMFEKVANDRNCPADIRAYASDTLPTLQEHQAKVKELQAMMKG